MNNVVGDVHRFENESKNVHLYVLKNETIKNTINSLISKTANCTAEDIIDNLCKIAYNNCGDYIFVEIKEDVSVTNTLITIKVPKNDIECNLTYRDDQWNEYPYVIPPVNQFYMIEERLCNCGKYQTIDRMIGYWNGTTFLCDRGSFDESTGKQHSTHIFFKKWG